jgi:hypothetical protein
MAQSITDPTTKDPDPLNQPLLGASSPGGVDDVGSQIDALYKKAGISDAGAGGGFADRAYWLAHPSEVLNGRLGRDLEGTGTDQPTGTPGRGPWLNSGRNAPEASIGEPTRKANGGFWDYGQAPIANPNVNTPSTWSPGGTSPSSPAPVGWHWDPNYARYVPDDPSLDTSLAPKTASSNTTGASSPTGAGVNTTPTAPLPGTVAGAPGGLAPTTLQPNAQSQAYRTALLNQLTPGGGTGQEDDPFGTLQP